jgi:histidyl-tRNA synthetase
VDFGIVRGLAYYTGMVFEIHEATGRERAIAGGGRYDQLVELFGGPPTPAVGFAMGDVVIRLVMQDHGLLEPGEAYLPRPDAFVVAASDAGSEAIPGVLATLRRAGLHARQSYRSTRNVGKLLGDAGKARARAAVILGDAVRDGMIAIKDLESGEQRDVELSSVADLIHRLPSPGKGD